MCLLVFAAAAEPYAVLGLLCSNSRSGTHFFHLGFHIQRMTDLVSEQPPMSRLLPPWSAAEAGPTGCGAGPVLLQTLLQAALVR